MPFPDEAFVAGVGVVVDAVDEQVASAALGPLGFRLRPEPWKAKRAGRCNKIARGRLLHLP